MYLYRYLCVNRPPAIGALPKDPVNVGYDVGYFTEDSGGHVVSVWGYVEYARKLTEQEECDYELMYDSEG